MSGAQDTRVGPEALLLLEIASPVACRPEALRAAVARCADWEKVLDLATTNQVPFQLAGALKAAGLLDELPEPVRHRLIGWLRQAVVLDGAKVGALAEIIERLDRKGIPLVLLKGLGLAERFYPRPYERASADIDILVPMSMRDGAGEALESLGYVAHCREYYEREHFHTPYIEPDRSTVVELHWQLTEPHSPVQFDVDRWWTSTRRRSLRSGEVLLPPATEELLHFAHHAFLTGRAQLKDLADVWHLFGECGKLQSADEVVTAVRVSSVGPFVHRALVLAEQLWGLRAQGLGELPRPPRGRGWLTRNLMAPPAIVELGDVVWWPHKTLVYWAMMPASIAGPADLIRRALEASWPIDEEAAGQSNTARAGIRLCSMVLAILICVLPPQVVPSGLYRK